MVGRGTSTLVEPVLTVLEEAADPERRERARGYFPTSMVVLGTPVPAQRLALRPLARALAEESPGRVLAVARALLDTGIHEARQVAFELVGGRADVIAGLDASEVEALARGNDNWASVDCFGVSVAGPAWRDGLVTDADVLRWAGLPGPWWRRTALVATVPLNMRSRGGRGAPERTLLVCRRLATDPHPMVAKGLSWALRALVGVDRGAVRAFMAWHGEAIPAQVRREVGNKLRTGLKSGRAT